MDDLAELRSRLDAVVAILTRGVSSAVVDGLRVEYDFAQLRLEEADLRRRIGRINGSAPLRRRIVFRTPPR